MLGLVVAFKAPTLLVFLLLLPAAAGIYGWLDWRPTRRGGLHRHEGGRAAWARLTCSATAIPFSDGGQNTGSISPATARQGGDWYRSA
jgi:hypothetical protein